MVATAGPDADVRDTVEDFAPDGEVISVEGASRHEAGIGRSLGEDMRRKLPEKKKFTAHGPRGRAHTSWHWY